MDEVQNDEVLHRLMEYLRLPGGYLDNSYDNSITFLKKQASLLDLPVRVFEYVKNKLVLVMSWTGRQPNLPAILLTSHINVTSVAEDKDSPVHMTEDGWISFLDNREIKGFGMLYLEAIKRLKDSGVQLKRTVHISFISVSDTLKDGMKKFTESSDFKELNVGFALDESSCSEEPTTINVFHGERCLKQNTSCHEDQNYKPTLTSKLITEDKILGIIKKIMMFRASEKEKSEMGDCSDYVTTVELAEVEGGIQVNELSEKLLACLDGRLKCGGSLENTDNTIPSWWSELGQVTKTNGNPYWEAMHTAVYGMGLKINRQICPGSTNARYIRVQGIPAVCFTAIINTPKCNENRRLHLDEYKRGIDTMENVITAVANV